MVSFGINCNSSLMFPFRKEASETLCLDHMAGVVAIGGGAEMRGVKSFGQSLDCGLGCPKFEEVSTTLVNGTAPGHHTGVLVTGVDVYNKSLTGNVSKTLGTSETDSDHIPCAILKKMQDFIDSLPSSIVRRLTPLECERLQGFPDYWTLVPTKKWRIIDELLYDELCSIGLGGYCRKANRRGKEVMQTCLASDGPRYKAIGNSWAVNNAQWIFQRIEEHDRDEAMQNAFA